MANILPETVYFHLVLGKNYLYPDTVHRCTIRSICMGHFKLLSGAPLQGFPGPGCLQALELN